MSEDNKVVIKINYQGAEKDKKAASEPQLINEWHIKRVIITLILLVFIISLFDYFFSGNTNDSELPVDNPPEQQKVLNSTVKLISKADIKTEPLVEINTSNKTHIKLPEKLEVIDTKSDNAVKKEEKVIDEKKQSSVTSSDPRITRALLTSGLNNKEPLDNISSFITVNENKAQGVYYFTEIMNMKGQRLSHHWLWNNKMIYKKTFNILGNRWRAATSKLIPYSKAGLWRVKLVNEKGDSLNEINFEVIKE